MKRVALTLAAFLLVAAAVLIGCRSSVDETPSSIPATAAEPTVTMTTLAPAPPETPSSGHHPDTTAAGSAAPNSGDTTNSGYQGTRDNPVPLGQEAQVGPWKVKVLEVTLDADDIVYNHSEFNEPPRAGSHYVLIKLEATRTGEEAAAFWVDTYYEFIGSGGETFEVAYADIPDPISETAEADPGASISGNLVFEVSSDQISDGTLRLSEAFSFEDVEVFFAVD
jgi:hypothetical protein